MNKLRIKRIRRDWQLYLLLFLPLLYYAVFMYMPMYGIQLAFKNFKPLLGINRSPWIGFAHFKNFFNSFYFTRIISNTVILNLYYMIVGFPIPIIFALMLNEVRIKGLKKFIQTITYFPHFISVVVLVSMITTFVNSQYGIINQMTAVFGIPPVNYLQEEQWFKTVHVYFEYRQDDDCWF